jgi:hypothetical protein
MCSSLSQTNTTSTLQLCTRARPSENPRAPTAARSERLKLEAGASARGRTGMWGVAPVQPAGTAPPSRAPSTHKRLLAGASQKATKDARAPPKTRPWARRPRTPTPTHHGAPPNRRPKPSREFGGKPRLRRGGPDPRRPPAR